jgi:hypothetical protein
LSAVTVAETILVFVGAPLAIIAVLALLIFLPGGRKRVRYKPGQPWEHAPIWYEPHPEGPAGGHGVAAAHGPAAVPGSSTSALGSSIYPEQPGERALEDRGGAGPAAGAGTGAGGAHGAPRPNPGGPLGGARGTW